MTFGKVFFGRTSGSASRTGDYGTGETSETSGTGETGGTSEIKK